MSAAERVIFVVPGDDPLQIQGSPHLDRLRPHGDVVVHTDRPATMEEQLERVEDAQVIINTRGTVKWHEGALRSLPKLRMIATCSIGTDMIDLGTTSEIGIVVSNQPGRTAGVVAEHAIGLMFAVAKRAHFQTAELKAGRWTRLENIFPPGQDPGGSWHRPRRRRGGPAGQRGGHEGGGVDLPPFGGAGHRARGPLCEPGRPASPLRRCEPQRNAQRQEQGDDQQEGDRPDEGGGYTHQHRQGRASRHHGSRRGPRTQATWRAPVWMSSTRSPFHQAHPILSCRQVVLTPHIADQTREGIEMLNEGAVNNVLAFLEGKPQNVVT